MEKWANSGIEDYRFRFQRLCSCWAVDPVSIEVVGGVVASVMLADTGYPPHPDLIDSYLTIDGISAAIRDAKDRNVFDRFRVQPLR